MEKLTLAILLFEAARKRLNHATALTWQQIKTIPTGDRWEAAATYAALVREKYFNEVEQNDGRFPNPVIPVVDIAGRESKGNLSPYVTHKTCTGNTTLTLVINTFYPEVRMERHTEESSGDVVVRALLGLQRPGASKPYISYAAWAYLIAEMGVSKEELLAAPIDIYQDSGSPLHLDDVGMLGQVLSGEHPDCKFLGRYYDVAVIQDEGYDPELIRLYHEPETDYCSFTNDEEMVTYLKSYNPFGEVGETILNRLTTAATA